MTELSGSEFAAAFHRDVVEPMLAQRFPGLRYVAARLGSGSDVLGFDDPMSRDHDWGARLTLLVDEPDREVVPQIDTLLEADLPDSYRGRPVRFGTTWSPDATHEVQVATVMDFAASRLGVDPRDGLSHLDWLCLTGHGVLETVGGPVFHDTTHSYVELKRLLAWYPPEVEGFVVASGWRRIAEGLPWVGRTADTGQDLQSRLITAGLVTDLVRLAFLRERVWIPYPKWREAAFHRLTCAEAMAPHLSAAVTAQGWRDREEALAQAIAALGKEVVPFYDRPYRTIDVPAHGLTGLPLVGSIEQWVDNGEILARPENRPAIIAAYRTWVSPPAA